MCARAVLFMDYCLNELGYSREEFGIVLDSSYENYDPYSPLAGEFFEANEDHDFVDGVCTDCGLLWAKCLGDRIKTWDSTYRAGKSIASIKSYDYPNLINPGDYVEIKFKDDFYIEFIYRNDSYEEYPIEFIFGTFADDRMGAMNLAFNYDGVEISNVNSTYIAGSYTIDLQDNLENINQYIADPAALKANAFTSYANDYDAAIPAEVWDLYFEYLPIMLDAFEYEANNCGYTLEDLGFNCK